MERKIIVNKFGGGILKKELIPFIEKRLKEQIKNGFQPTVVVSALPGVTDELLGFLNKLKFRQREAREIFIKNLQEKHSKIMADIGFSQSLIKSAQLLLDRLLNNLEKDLLEISWSGVSDSQEDRIVAYGEKLSATLFAVYFSSLGLPAKRIFAEEVPIITNAQFKNANIIYDSSEKNIQRIFLKEKKILVIPGFTGRARKGDTTTLGRGGTDTTACFIGSALHASKIILWKDVGGVLSADPMIVKGAQTIPFISYQEAEEAGKIIHDKAIQYAKLRKTPVEIASLPNPKLNTKIIGSRKLKKGAKIVSFKKDLTLFLITDEVIKGNELLSIVSQAFAKNKVDVILISNTRYSLQIVAENGNGSAENVLAELKKKVFQVVTYPVSMVYLVGNFGVQDVNDFNSLLIKLKTNLEISAFLYKNCTRLEAIIRTPKIESVVRALYKKFIK